MADVLQSHSPCSVPVGFHLSPLHPRLMYLPFLLISPVQHAVAQQGSLFRAGDVQDWQLSVNQGGNLWSSCVALCEPPLVLVVHFHPSFCAC